MSQGPRQESEFLPKTFSSLRGYSFAQAFSDLAAGLGVGIIALPLAMAFAIASGVSPAEGLYTAVIAGFLTSLFSGSPVQIGGPTGAFVVIISATVQKQGTEGLALATLMSSCLLLLLGYCRAGFFLRYIKEPVIIGFTAGIALIIFSCQMKDFFGLTVIAEGCSLLSRWISYLQAPSFNPHSAALSLSSLSLIIALKAYFPKAPAYLLAILYATTVAHHFDWPVDTIGSKFGSIPSQLPFPSLPALTWQKAMAVWPDTLAITGLAALESLLCAATADRLAGTSHSPNCELVAQGIANFGSVLFGGIPSTGAIARTAANIRMGGKTPVSGMIHALFLLLVMNRCGGLAAQIPLSALAAILVSIAWQMADLHQCRALISGKKEERAIFLVSFLLTAFVDLAVAVMAGVLLSFLLPIKRKRLG
ncbi:MAG: hypothetical protein K0S07_921 [Chlamydiales bacterium]|jgi:SulP family sulfate permease|nr:hypothetical protein [Chlamydiales bacterium]